MNRFGAAYAVVLVLTLGGSLLAADPEPKPEDKAEPKPEPKSIFPDKNLEAVVRHSVFDKRNTDEPITEDDVRDVAIIEGKGRGVRDLTGLEKCISVALIDLAENEIVDLSPLRGLDRLQSLTLSKNKIQDVSPLIESVALQYLHLADNQIADLSPLAGQTNLRSLYLSNNRIEDIGPLEALTKLWSLYLDGNAVSDIGPLASLKSLSSLDLRGNRIADLSPLAGLDDLKYVFLEGNRIRDLATLVAMARKDEETDKRFAPYWRIYLTGNPLTEAARSQQIAELQKLGGRITFEANGTAAPPASLATVKAISPQMMQMAAPGSEHRQLARMAGNWEVTSRYWPSPDADPIETAGTLYRSMILGGRFLHEDLWLGTGDLTVHGIGHIGYDNFAKQYVMTWIDNLGTFVQVAHGSFDPSNNTYTFEGEVPNPVTGQPVRQRSVLRVVNNNEQTFEIVELGENDQTFRRLEATATRR